jgi:large-conductance mechanosensitive channel
MKNFINEFKKFAMRGNVIDMAVGEIVMEALHRLADILVASSLGEHGGIDGVINSAHFSVSPFRCIILCGG